MDSYVIAILFYNKNVRKVVAISRQKVRAKMTGVDKYMSS
jgi:hypothetical protein